MKNFTLSKHLFVIISALLLASLACSLVSGQPDTQQTQPPPEETGAVDQPDESSSSGVITGIENVKQAVIQIVAVGTFVDPEFGEATLAGSGTGFIIDPSGIAVTNNHVVTGGTVFKVTVGGDTSKTYNATVVAVSECSDLAVIDIEGSGFPYLTWHEGPVTVGMDVYVAGFPLGDPNFTLTKGIVSKEKANGSSSSSSVESVIEYDATSNPGNSGGPALDANGKVIAVHYMGNREARQAFGIHKDLAVGVIDKLLLGENIESIGINGEAVATEDGSIEGIWASSVQPGSIADSAGVRPGDIVTKLGDLPVATDGTMLDYCDIIRSHNSSETLPIEVLRWSTGEILSGQLNGSALTVISTTTIGSNGGDSNGTSTGTSSIEGVTTNENASQPGEYYYQTEFDTAEDWTYFVLKGNENGFTQEAYNSKFRLEINKANTWVYFINNTYNYSDVELTTNVENRGQNTNWVGLICRYSEDGWYEANILNTGEFAIYASNGGSLQTMYTGASTLINMGREVNEYSFICKGDEVTLGINGYIAKTVPTRTSSYPLLREGLAGISFSSSTVFPLSVEFDWFTTSVPY